MQPDFKIDLYIECKWVPPVVISTANYQKVSQKSKAPFYECMYKDEVDWYISDPEGSSNYKPLMKSLL